MTIEERLAVVAPAITAHLDGLVMDTPEDNALLDEIRRQWQWVLTGDEVPTPFKPRDPFCGAQIYGTPIPIPERNPSDTPVSQHETETERFPLRDTYHDFVPGGMVGCCAACGYAPWARSHQPQQTLTCNFCHRHSTHGESVGYCPHCGSNNLTTIDGTFVGPPKTF